MIADFVTLLVQIVAVFAVILFLVIFSQRLISTALAARREAKREQMLPVFKAYLTGDASLNQLSDAVGRATNGAEIIVLDLSSLKMITSAGVGIVMKAQTSLAKRGGELMMLNMQPQIKKVFEIVRLLPTLQVFDDTQEMDNYLIKIQQRIQEDGSFDSTQ